MAERLSTGLKGKCKVLSSELSVSSNGELAEQRIEAKMWLVWEDRNATGMYQHEMGNIFMKIQGTTSKFNAT